MFWRKREPLHERLAREGGMPAQGRTDELDSRDGSLHAGPLDTAPRWGEVGIHGVHRPREWDAVSIAEAPELAGSEARFVALADGSILAETDDLGLEPLAAALDGSIQRRTAPRRFVAATAFGQSRAVGSRSSKSRRTSTATGSR